MATPYWEALFNAMYVETQEQADETLEKLILQCQKEDPTLNYAICKHIQLANLGWMFGEVAPETRLHAMQFYPEAQHPIFGRHFSHTPEQVLNAGMTVARAMHEGKSITEAAQEARTELAEQNENPPADN